MILAVTPPLYGLLGALAALAYGLVAGASSRLSVINAVRLGWLAWGLHAVVLVMGLSASPAHFGFGPALSVTAWLVGLVYVLERQFFPALRLPAWLLALGAGAVLIAWVFPGAPLPASGSAWLPLHWALGIAAYGLFAMAVVHAAGLGRAERRMRSLGDAPTGLPLLTLERLTFRFVGLGFVLLSATLAAGWLFGSVLYPGHALRLDHKTVFSVLAWLTFAVLLAGRWRLGWRGRRAVRVLYGGCALLLLAYVGSRFVLEVVLSRSV